LLVDQMFKNFEKKKAEARGQKVETSPKHERETSNEQMPLNKFIAHCGVSSRRDAAEMVKLGKVKVNNEMITEPGHKVSAKDEIIVNGKKVFLSKNLVYILLNKPKDYITTTDDPQKRKTVLDLIKIKERIYPVGRLDRNTSGVLLIQIRDRDAGGWEQPYISDDLSDHLTRPFFLLQHNWYKMMEYDQNNLLSYYAENKQHNIYKLNFQYASAHEEGKAALNFHLTQREKKDILQSLNSPFNQKSSQMYKQLLAGIDSLNIRVE